MGKSVGFLGPISGRVGNTVGYVLKDASKQTQGWRVYQPNVGNPQTDAQMQQRVRLTAINNQYRALKEIISRGFEGLNYGNVSRRKYLSMAMGQRFEGPWLAKDDKRPVPVLQIPITVGSLPQVVCEPVAADGWFLTNLTGVTADPGDSIGTLSAIFVASGYHEGDQVTFCFGVYGEGGTVQIKWESFYIAVDNTDPLPDMIANHLDSSGGNLCVTIVAGELDAVAISVSRDGDGSHLRSTTYWAIDETLEGAFYADSAYRQNSPSYIRHRSANTNWELDTDVEGGGGGGGGSVQLAYTISGTEIEPQSLSPYSAQNPIQIVGGNGSKYFILTRSGASQAYINGAGTTVDSVDGGTNANTVDVYSERNKAQNLRAWLIAHGIQASVLPAYT